MKLPQPSLHSSILWQLWCSQHGPSNCFVHLRQPSFWLIRRKCGRAAICHAALFPDSPEEVPVFADPIPWDKSYAGELESVHFPSHPHPCPRDGSHACRGHFNTFSTVYSLLCLLQAGVAPKERWDYKQHGLSVAPLNMMCFSSIISSETGTKFCSLLHKANLHLGFVHEGSGWGECDSAPQCFPLAPSS